MDISETEMPAMNYISVRSSAKIYEIGSKMEEMSALMMEYIEKNNLKNAGAPFAI